MFFSKRKKSIYPEKSKSILIFLMFFFFSSQLLQSKDFTHQFNPKVPIKNKNHIRDEASKEELVRIQNIDKLERANQEMLISKNRKIWLALVTVSIFTLAFILFVILRQFSKSRVAGIQILKLETQLMQTELELLQIKNESAKNAIQSSKNLQIKIQDIIEGIRQSDISKEPQIIAIRQDLERLISVSFQGKTRVETTKSDERIYQQLKQIFPELKDLNATSVQILIFSLKDATPMFISSELNLNVQYVRNVRSRLKAILNHEKSEHWNWSSLNEYHLR